jgi:hypothetical protein
MRPDNFVDTGRRSARVSVGLPVDRNIEMSKMDHGRLHNRYSPPERYPQCVIHTYQKSISMTSRCTAGKPKDKGIATSLALCHAQTECVTRACVSPATRALDRHIGNSISVYWTSLSTRTKYFLHHDILPRRNFFDLLGLNYRLNIPWNAIKDLAMHAYSHVIPFTVRQFNF